MFLYLRLSLLYQSRFRSSLRPWHCMPVWAWPCDVFIRTDMTKTALVGVRLDTATQRLSLSNLGMFLQCQQTALNLKTNSLSSILSQNPSYEFYKIFPHSSPTKRDCQSQTNKSSACIPFLSFCKQLYGEGPSASSESLFLEYPNSCQATPKLNHNVTKSSLKIYIYDIRCTGIQYMLYIYMCIHIYFVYMYTYITACSVWRLKCLSLVVKATNPHLFVAVQLACRTAGMGAMRPTSCMVPTAATRSIKHAVETSWPCHEYLFETWSLSNITIRLILFDK